LRFWGKAAAASLPLISRTKSPKGGPTSRRRTAVTLTPAREPRKFFERVESFY
jgi:hypothetical protein